MAPCGECLTPSDQHLAPEYRRWRRIHGLQLPLHGQQLAAWFLLLLASAVTGGVLVPALCPPLRIPAAALAGAVLLGHLITHAVAMLLDPAHADLRARRERVPVPEFDRNVHAHVIENGRCHLCNIGITSTRTKHCSVCNKCVDRFDHHCKWLNHCIGRRNYGWFLACVASAAAVSLLVLTLSAGEIILLFFSPDLLGDCGLCSTGNGTATSSMTTVTSAVTSSMKVTSTPMLAQTNSASCPVRLAMFGLPVRRSAFISVAGMFTLLSLVCGILLVHLLLFHVYIMARGMTTYEYIRGLVAPRSKTPPKRADARCRFLAEALHRNRVRPGPSVQHKEAGGSTSPSRPASGRDSPPPSRASRLTGVSIETLAKGPVDPQVPAVLEGRPKEGQPQEEEEERRIAELEGMQEKERKDVEERVPERIGSSPERCSWIRRGGDVIRGDVIRGEVIRGEVIRGEVIRGVVTSEVKTPGPRDDQGARGDADVLARLTTERCGNGDIKHAPGHGSLLAKLVKSVRALSAITALTATASDVDSTPPTTATSNGQAVRISNSTNHRVAPPQAPSPIATSANATEALASSVTAYSRDASSPHTTPIISRWRRTSLPWLLDGSGDLIEPGTVSDGDDAPYHWTGKVHTAGHQQT